MNCWTRKIHTELPLAAHYELVGLASQKLESETGINQRIQLGNLQNTRGLSRNSIASDLRYRQVRSEDCHAIRELRLGADSL